MSYQKTQLNFAMKRAKKAEKERDELRDERDRLKDEVERLKAENKKMEERVSMLCWTIEAERMR